MPTPSRASTSRSAIADSSPALRRAAESEARARVDAGFEGADAHARFLTLGRQLSTLLAGFDPKDRDALDRIAPLFPAGLGDWQLAFTRRATFEAPIPRSERTPPVAGVADELGLAARGLGALWPKTLIGGEPLQLDGAAGDLVTWHSAQLSSDALEAASALAVERDRARFLAEAERFHRAATRLRARLAPGAAERERWSLANSSEVDTALDALEQARAEFLEASGQPKPTAWDERQTLDRFAQTVVFGATDPAAPRTKPEAPARLRSEALIAATAPTTLAALSPEAWSPAALAALPSTIATVCELAQRAGDDGAPLALRVLRAKCEFVAADHLRLAGSWDALLTALGGTPSGAAPSGAEMRRLLASGLRHLVELRQAITAFGAEATVFDAWQRRIDELLVAGLDATKAAITRDVDVAASDQELLRALHGAWLLGKSLGGVLGASLTGRAQSAADEHVGNVQSLLASRWSTPGTDQALPALDVVLRELDEHLGRIPRAGEGEFVDTMVVQWLKTRVGLLLAGRLEQFVAELGVRHDKLLEETRCEALLARGGPDLDVRGLAGLARTARTLLTRQEIGAWQNRRVAGLFDAATVGPQLDRLAAWAPLAAVAVQLRTMCSRVDALADFEKRSHRLEVMTWCLGELEKLETSKTSEAGPGLARVLIDLRQRWRSQVLDAEPSASVVDWYLDRLEGAFDARAVTVLRRKYLEELASSVKLAGNLAAALRVAPAMSAGERRTILGRVDAARLAIAEELGNLVFGEDSVLARLESRYALDRGGFEFRPAPAERDEAWKFDAFLHALRAFLRGETPPKDLSEVKVKVTLKPVTRREDIWAEYDFLATVFFGTSQRLWDNSLANAPLTIEWRFDRADTAGFWFRWTRSNSAQLGDDIRFEVQSCIAPLLLVWAYGTAVTSGDAQEDGVKVWDVLVPELGPRPLTARFTLEFEREVPIHPGYPKGW